MDGRARRGFLKAAGAAALIPTLARAQDTHLPDQTLTAEFAYEAVVTLDPATPVGDTPYGKRNRIPITGGSFAGPRIKGKVLAGGMDWQLIRPDGCLDLYADYMMQADDGTLIHVINKGLISMDRAQPYNRCTPVFEVPIGPHDWLNKAMFTGNVVALPDEMGKAVHIRVYRLPG